MARKQNILLRRSVVQYNKPDPANLNLGEAAINTNDGKLFIKKSTAGTTSIVELGVGPTFQLTTGGSPLHTHSVSITGQQALNLLDGTSTTVTVQSSSEGTTPHTHLVTIEYDAVTKGFVLNTAGGITSNHTVVHTLVSNGGGAAGASSIATLSDVDTTGIANNKILKYDLATSKWKMADDAAGTTIAALTDITDVNTGATNGQVLNWNSGTSKWAPVNQAGGHAYTEGTTTPSSPSVGDEFYNQTNDTLYKYVNDGSSNAWIDISTDSVLSIGNIDELGDVDTTTTAPTGGQVLKWNTASSKWYPADDIDTTLSLSTADLTDIGDVDTGATNGQVLKWNTTGTKWVPSDDTNTDTIYTHPNHSGDVTSVADGVTTIANNAVSLAKMADMATASFIGRNTALAGDPEILSATTARSILNVEDGATNIAALTDISDVDTGATDGQVLKWNTTGTKWVPSDDTIGLLTDKGSTTVGTTVVLLDSWSATTYLSAKYYVTCKVGTSYSTSEIRILNKGGASSDIIEYGHLGDNLITFSTSIVSGNVQLNGISTTASTVVRVARVLQGV